MKLTAAGFVIKFGIKCTYLTSTLCCICYWRQYCGAFKGMQSLILMDSVREGEGGKIWENGIETCKISCRNELPVQVRYTILDAWGWCTGTTQRDGMGREEGGGFRMGNTCIPVADSF